VTAYHGDNYEVLVHRFFRKDRAVMFELAAKLDLVATSSDDSLLAALQHARAYHAARRDHIPLPPPAAGGAEADSGLGFALAREPAALAGVPAATRGILRRGRPARDGIRVHRAPEARAPGRRRGAGHGVRGQRRPGDRR